MLLTNKQLYKKGKRSFVYLATSGNKQVIIKEQRVDTDAMNVLEKEAQWLKLVNTKKIGPKFYHLTENEIIMEYIDGVLFPSWVETANKKEILLVLDELLKQCFTLDTLGISKEEMTNPYKHILIRNNKPVLIDFERARKRTNPQNVTQFCHYITSTHMSKKLSNKDIHFNVTKTRELTAGYKRNLKKTFSLKDILCYRTKSKPFYSSAYSLVS